MHRETAVAIPRRQVADEINWLWPKLKLPTDSTATFATKLEGGFESHAATLPPAGLREES